VSHSFGTPTILLDEPWPRSWRLSQIFNEFPTWPPAAALATSVFRPLCQLFRVSEIDIDECTVLLSLRCIIPSSLFSPSTHLSFLFPFRLFSLGLFFFELSVALCPFSAPLFMVSPLGAFIPLGSISYASSVGIGNWSSGTSGPFFPALLLTVWGGCGFLSLSFFLFYLSSFPRLWFWFLLQWTPLPSFPFLEAKGKTSHRVGLSDSKHAFLRFPT